MKACFTLVLFFIAFTVNAAPTQKDSVIITPASTELVCWYQDKRFSEGAIIMMETTRVICTARNQFESNGRLAWRMINDQGQIIYPTKQSKKITIQ